MRMKKSCTVRSWEYGGRKQAGLMFVRQCACLCEKRSHNPGCRKGKREEIMRELDYRKMGMRIRQVRKAKGWSQNELAEKCGISMSFLGHIERGTRIMSMETFANICNALDAGADELLWGVAAASDAVLNMWNLPGKSRKGRGRQDKNQNKNQDKRNQKKNSRDNQELQKASHIESAEQNPEEETGYGTDSGKTDSYAMYVRIMKSVAEIMNDA